MNIKAALLLLFALAQTACFALALDPAVVRQGRCFTISMTAESFSSARASFLGRNIPFHDGQAIIGVAPEQRPGRYPLLVTAKKLDGETVKLNGEVTVAKFNFPSVSFWLKPAKNKLRARNIIAEEWARIEKVLLLEDEKKYRLGNFILPVDGPVSMVFGSIERINGRRSGQHRGLDIAVQQGTKVAAANSGKIVFAAKLKAFGGTIVIDHGRGIHTLYFHLSKFLADVGQGVAKGEVIALSGNTGISSGPHLHWGMSVHNLRVDPVQWTKNAL